MTLINPVLIAALGFAAIPVVLHFIMRAKPKRVIFPALRLIQLRRRQNVRRMRLRHIWLLLLRIAIIALIVLAVARPTLPSADYDLSTPEVLTLTTIIGLAALLYWAAVWKWKKQAVPQHVMTYRRTMLRGTAGGLAAAAVLLLVVWPYWERVSAEMTAPLTSADEDLPVSAVLMIDTSPSMDYRENNRTRLEVAKSIGNELLSNFVSGSRVAVFDSSSTDAVPVQADLAAAKSRIEGLTTQPVTIPLNSRLMTAVRLQIEARERELGIAESTGAPSTTTSSDRFVREIYVITDLSRSGWRMSSAEFLRGELARAPWLHVYLIDVGSEQPHNVALTEIRFLNQTASVGDDVTLRATVSAIDVDASEPQTVQLRLLNDMGKQIVIDKQTVSFETGSGQRDIDFTLNGVQTPFVQGDIRLAGSDPLLVDDVRHFTVTVRDAPQVMLVGEPVNDVSRWKQALEALRFTVKFESIETFTKVRLDGIDCVVMVNVRRPSGDDWQRLETFVKQGGGLAIVLGDSQINAESYNQPESAQELLPAALIASVAFLGEPASLDIPNPNHPLVKQLIDIDDAWVGLIKVFRRWAVRPVADATVVARYDIHRSHPALLERVVGTGRVVMITTGEFDKWSNIAGVWPFLALNEQLVQLLTGRSDEMSNWTAGDSVLLRQTPQSEDSPPIMLRLPDLQQHPLEKSSAPSITVSETPSIGSYQLQRAGTSIAGFSVNLPPSESDFTRLDKAEFDALFGENRYSVTRDLDELERIVNNTRMGEELFRYVLTLVLMVFCGEHLVANKFHENANAQG